MKPSPWGDVVLVCRMAASDDAVASINRPWSIRTASGAVLTMPNGFVMAPMTRRQATEHNEPYEIHARYYAARAAGGVGLIITEGTHVNNTTAVDAPTTPQCRTAAQVAGWKAVAEAVHAAGSKIAMQIWHTGLLSMNPVGPSAPEPPVSSKPPTVLNREQMESIANDFAQTAVACIRGAGFDAVEVHGAHGYLLDTFAAKRWNKRQDEFATHHAFPCMVVRAIRNAVGPDVPIIYRFSQWTLMDYQEIKFDTSAELAEFVVALREAGVDCLHASTRTATAPAFPKEDAKRTLAGWTKLLSGLPTIAVGGVGVNREFGRGGQKGEAFENADPTPALELVRSGEVDALAVGRALLTDKLYCAKVASGKWRECLPYTPNNVGALDW